jgi:hypothetical protein
MGAVRHTDVHALRGALIFLETQLPPRVRFLGDAATEGAGRSSVDALAAAEFRLHDAE